MDELIQAVKDILDEMLPVEEYDEVRGQYMVKPSWGAVENLIGALDAIDPSWVSPIIRNRWAHGMKEEE